MKQWKDIFQGNYKVSDIGEVYSMYKKGLLIPSLHWKGYYTVNIKGKNHRVSRLVAINFIPNPSNLPQVNHKNGIKTDNRIENLEWCTNQENQTHSWMNGRKSGKLGKKRINGVWEHTRKYKQ